MKINIRHNVFETNSSSMHSIVIDSDDNKYIDKSKLPKHKRFDPNNMGFGWGPEIRTSIYDRIGYAIAWAYENCEEKDMIEKIQKILNMEIEYDKPSCPQYKYGYIDHQSIDVLPEFLNNENIDIEEFITNDKYHIWIDHDNGSNFTEYMLEMKNKNKES